MKITIEMDAADLKAFLEARDAILQELADLKRTPAKGSAEERARKILEGDFNLTPGQRANLQAAIMANVLG